MSNVRTHTATEADMDSILSLTNEAFMADAFFKKKEYHERFDAPTVQQMINAENSRFIIATQTIDETEVSCGSIFFHWEVSTTEDSLQVKSV
jgi:hypothetical protein